MTLPVDLLLLLRYFISNNARYFIGIRQIGKLFPYPAMVVVFALIAAIIISYNDGSDNNGPSIYCYYGPMFGPIDPMNRS